MKWFLDLGNRYAEKSDWKDFALTKFCLCSIGVLLGIRVKPAQKKIVEIGAASVFLVTYVPLMAKLFAVAKETSHDK